MFFIFILLKKWVIFGIILCKVVDYLENLLNWSMFLGDSNNENIRDLNFVFFRGG